MEPTNERRHEPRVRVQVRLTIADPETGRRHVLTTTNVSAGGASCTSFGPLGWRGELEGRLDLPVSEGGRDVEEPLVVRVRYLREEKDGQVAVAFDMDESARAALRSFLLDSVADDACPLRELAGSLA